LCEIYYEEFHGITDFSLVNNSYIAAGGQGMVFKCECAKEGIEPAVTAQKVYYTVSDKNITEMQAVGYAVSEAGIRAPLYWYHDAGYFEEFLGHKKDLWDHSTGVRVDDQQVWRKTAKNLGELHQVNIDGIDKEKYTKPYSFETSGMSGFWNTREIKQFFAEMEIIMASPNIEKNKENLLGALGMTLEEYNWNIEWIEKLVRDYYKDEEKAVVSHNDPHAGNMMMDRNDTTAESLILIDWDLTQYGYRAFDLAYYIYYASFVNIFNLNGEGYDPEVLPDVDLGYYLPDAYIEDFLTTYLKYSGDTTTTIKEITTEFNIHTTYLVFMQIVLQGFYGAIDLGVYQYAICKLEELQKLFDHPNPIDCHEFPYNRPKCDECETILVDCLMNCGGDSSCASNCNRDHAACLESCK